MDTLLSVLLYIHALPGPGQYPASYIDQLSVQRQSQIILIESNKPQLTAVMQMEQPIVAQIIIIGEGNTGN